MLDTVTTGIGFVAAALSALSYLPQVRKAWPRGATGDLSLGMLAVLTTGLALWIVYGLLRQVWVIAGANFIAASLTGVVLGCKLRDMWSGRPGEQHMDARDIGTTRRGID